MEKQYAPTANEKKVVNPAQAQKNQQAAKPVEAKVEEKKVETQSEQKTETKEPKKVVQKLTKKDQAVVNGLSIAASKKHSMYISNFIKGKKIDDAIAGLEQVIKLKKAIAFKGEIPHRHDAGMMSGRYPVNASKIFIQLLKGLKGNALVNQMDLDKTRIFSSSASWASRPQRRGGVTAKRTNVIIIAKEIEAKENKNQKTKESKK